MHNHNLDDSNKNQNKVEDNTSVCFDIGFINKLKIGMKQVQT